MPFPVTFIRDGFTVTARIEPDDCGEAPWIADEGHGPVTDWTTRSKRAGERILNQDRGVFRYYDFAEACKIALRDGWNCAQNRTDAAKAAEEDFRRLRAWCNNDWTYVGVVLSVARNGVTLDNHAASLWGIESDCGDYLAEVAEDLVDDAANVGRVILAKINA